MSNSKFVIVTGDPSDVIHGAGLFFEEVGPYATDAEGNQLYHETAEEVYKHRAVDKLYKGRVVTVEEAIAMSEDLFMVGGRPGLMNAVGIVERLDESQKRIDSIKSRQKEHGPEKLRELEGLLGKKGASRAYQELTGAAVTIDVDAKSSIDRMEVRDSKGLNLSAEKRKAVEEQGRIAREKPVVSEKTIKQQRK